MQYDIITWDRLENAIDKIANQVKTSNANYEAIYGLPRGGLVPAVMLSHRLQVSLILNMEEVWRLKVNGRDVLIVDDISDSGRTLKYFGDQKFDIATVSSRVNKTQTTPKYNGIELTHEDWVVFPWEDSKNIIVDHNSNI